MSTRVQKIDFSKAIVVNFDPVSEKWCQYELSDGGIVKIRPIITGVIRLSERDPNTSEPLYRWNHTEQFCVIPNPELRSSPSQGPMTPERTRQSISNSVDFDSKGGEEWSMYNLSDGTVLKAKIELQKVIRTSLYDNLGNPVYGHSSTLVHRLSVNRELIERPTSSPEEHGPYS